MAKSQLDHLRAVVMLVVQLQFRVALATVGAHLSAVLDGRRHAVPVFGPQPLDGQKRDPLIGGELAERDSAGTADHHIEHEESVALLRDETHVREAAVGDVRTQLREIHQAEQDPAVTPHENKVAIEEVRRRPVVPGEFCTAITPRELGEQVRRVSRGQRG